MKGGKQTIRWMVCRPERVSPIEPFAPPALHRSCRAGTRWRAWSAVGPKTMASERRACRALGQHRSTQGKVPVGCHDEERLTADIIELARLYGRYGHRQVTGMLVQAGWCVNHKRVERIWRREGLKVPRKQKKRGRLWLAPSRDIAAQCPAGQWRAHACACAWNDRTTSGPMISSRTGRRMGALTACSTSSRNIPERFS